MQRAFHYRWNGLRVRSAIELSGLPRLGEHRTAPPDVTVSLRESGCELPSPDPLPLRQRFVLKIPGVARYTVTGGRRIDVLPFGDSDARDVRLFLMGSAMGVLCHQRGLLPLHASSVRVGNACVAFVGPSGAGKSTLAAFLSRAGFPMVSDDVTVVAPGRVEGPLVFPGPRHVKLWRQGVDALCEDASSLERIRGRREKYLLELPVETAPLPLTRIYCIADGDAPRLERLRGIAARFAVMGNIYRRSLAGQMGLEQHLFESGTTVAGGVDVYRFGRARGFDRMGEHLSVLADHWRAGPISEDRLAV